jgi:hemerythrin superfamily protein
MNAVDLLIEQHHQIESRMKQLLGAERPADRAALFAQVGDHLTVHIASEEQVFYPAVKAARTEDVLLESLEEHLSLKRLLADLVALDVDDKTFEPKFEVLKEQTEHHHREEEDDLFPKVRRMLDEPRLDALGDEMMLLQKTLRRAGDPRENVAGETDRAAPL